MSPTLTADDRCPMSELPDAPDIWKQGREYWLVYNGHEGDGLHARPIIIETGRLGPVSLVRFQLVRYGWRRATAAGEECGRLRDYESGMADLRRLWSVIAPQCNTSDTLSGLASQIDNYCAGAMDVEKERDALHAILDRPLDDDSNVLLQRCDEGKPLSMADQRELYQWFNERGVTISDLSAEAGDEQQKVIAAQAAELTALRAQLAAAERERDEAKEALAARDEFLSEIISDDGPVQITRGTPDLAARWKAMADNQEAIPYGRCDKCGFSTVLCTCEENEGRPRELPDDASPATSAEPELPMDEPPQVKYCDRNGYYIWRGSRLDDPQPVFDYSDGMYLTREGNWRRSMRGAQDYFKTHAEALAFLLAQPAAEISNPDRMAT